MTNFAEQVKKVLDFMTPENLTQQTIAYTGDTALLVIDTQRMFCDPASKRGTPKTAEIAEKIQSIAPAFRKLGIPVYAVYYEEDRDDAPDFYKFEPAPEDILVAKNHDSAFHATELRELLQKDGRNKLLTCGFNLNACVMRTVINGVDRGFEMTVLKDLCGNDAANTADPDFYLLQMKMNGAKIENNAIAVVESFLNKAPTAPGGPA